MDLSKLSTGDKVIGGSGIALLLFSFLPWFRFSAFGITATQNGFDYFVTGIVPVLLGLPWSAGSSARSWPGSSCPSCRSPRG